MIITMHINTFFFKQILYLRKNFPVFTTCNGRPRYKYQEVFVVRIGKKRPESVFQPALHFVPDYAFADFFADRKTDLETVCFSYPVYKHDMFGGNTLSGIINVTEFLVSFQRIASVQKFTSIQRSISKNMERLCGQNLPAFGPSALQYDAAVAGFHSLAEAVHFFSLPFFGLIRLQHFVYTPISILYLLKKPSLWLSADKKTIVLYRNVLSLSRKQIFNVGEVCL